MRKYTHNAHTMHTRYMQELTEHTTYNTVTYPATTTTIAMIRWMAFHFFVIKVIGEINIYIPHVSTVATVDGGRCDDEACPSRLLRDYFTAFPAPPVGLIVIVWKIAEIFVVYVWGERERDEEMERERKGEKKS